MNAPLKANPPLLIDPNILTDIGPTDRKTEVKHQLSRAGGRKGVERLGPIQIQEITMTSEVFDDLSSNTLNRRTAASGDFVLTNPKLEAEASNLGTVPNPPEGVQDRDRSRMLDRDGTVVRFARLGKSGHSALHRSASGAFPTLCQRHEESNGRVGKVREFGT